MGRSTERPTEPIRMANWNGMGQTSAGGRAENQDWYECFTVLRAAASPLSVAVVADGVGGEQGGGLASHAAVGAVRRHIESLAGEDADIARLLGGSILAANEVVLEDVWRRQGIPHAASTLVIAAIAGDVLYVAHVGDSRAYLIRHGRAYRLTVDHTVVEEALGAGRITAAEAAAHPELHTITRYTGDPAGTEPDLNIVLPEAQDAEASSCAHSLTLVPGDRVVLCTDGLTDALSDPEIAQIGGRALAQQVPEMLVGKANAQYVQDNVTAVILTQQSSNRAPAGSALSWLLILGIVAVVLAILSGALAWAASGPPTPATPIADYHSAQPQLTSNPTRTPAALVVVTATAPLLVPLPSIARMPTNTPASAPTATPSPAAASASVSITQDTGAPQIDVSGPISAAETISSTGDLTQTQTLTDVPAVINRMEIELDRGGPDVFPSNKVTFVISGDGLGEPPANCVYEMVIWDEAAATPPFTATVDPGGVYGLGQAMSSGGALTQTLDVGEYQRDFSVEKQFRSWAYYCLGLRLACNLESPASKVWLGPNQCTCDSEHVCGRFLYRN